MLNNLFTTLLLFDQHLTTKVKNLIPSSDFFDLFFSFFSLQGNALYIWIAFVVLFLIFEERKNPGLSEKDKRFLIVFTLSFAVTSFVVSYPLKNFFKRPRPSYVKNNQIKDKKHSCPSDYSFPSSHAATAFASFYVLSVFDKKRRLLHLTIALVIAYSRIYLGCHYLLDVMVGAVIGFLLSKLTVEKIKIPIKN